MLILLADAELELVPEQLWNEEDVIREAKSKGKEPSRMILDNHSMRNAIRRMFPGKEGRIGFPQIAYLFHIMNKETVLNGHIEVDYAIHTKHNVIIEKSDLIEGEGGYESFIEIIERMLWERSKTATVMDYLDQKGIAGNTVVLHPQGRSGLLPTAQSNYVIGGFPQGDFVSDLGKMRRFSIYEEEITVPGVLELLHFRIFKQLSWP
jgi:rRNA small subunit pseudouridine methyltransferase Nep1